MDKYIDWNINPTEIIKKTTKIIKKSLKTNDKIANYNFELENDYNIFLSLLADDITIISTYHSIYGFLKHVSYNKNIQEASNDADNMISTHLYKLNTREDIYNKILEFKKRYYKKIKCIDKYFIDKILISYNKEGFGLKSNKDDFINVKNKIYNLENEIRENIMVDEKLVGLHYYEIN